MAESGRRTGEVMIEKVRLGPAPALLGFTGNASRAAGTGTILFYHGLGVSKETQLTELQSLADRGFLAVGIDNVGHGERRYQDFDARFGVEAADRWRAHFIDAVRATVEEIPTVVDELQARGMAQPGKIGVAGISMGGCITYGAVLRDRRLTVAVSILGSPRWGGPDSPHERAADFYPVALLSQNAGHDEHVPSKEAQDFHNDLQRWYLQEPGRQRHIVFPKSGHMMREDEWQVLWENTLGWFSRFFEGA